MTTRALRFVPALAAAAMAFSAAFAPPARAQAQKASELRFPPLPDVPVPAPQRVVLDNGLTVLLLEDRELPLVEATALVRTGAIAEPGDKAGLAELTGRVLRSGGAGRMSGDELDDFLEDRAATIETSISEDTGTARLSALKGNFPDVFRAFTDILRRPAFDAAKIELARNRMVAEVARQNDDPQEILDREFRKLVYGKDSPFARTPSFASLAAIRRADLVAWHGKYFQPDRIVLGIVGDIDAAATLALIKETLGDWPRGPKLQEPAPPAPREVRPGVYTIDLDALPQSSIAMGYLGIRRDDPDLFPVEVLNQVLGGSFASRLFANVRSKKALGYVVYGGVFSDWGHPDVTQLVLTTKGETTGAGIAALLDEAKDIVAHPPTDREVAEAKQAILSSFVFTRDSLRKVVLRQLLPLEYWGYPADWFERYRAGVEAVTPEQVRKAAERLIHPERFAILVVGPAGRRERPLTDFGPVTPVDISIPGAPRAPKP